MAVDAAAVAADLEGVDVHSLGGVLLDDLLDAVHAEAVRPVAHPVPDDHGRRRGRGCEYRVEGGKCQSSHFSRTTTPSFVECEGSGCVNIQKCQSCQSWFHATTPKIMR